MAERTQRGSVYKTRMLVATEVFMKTRACWEKSRDEVAFE